MFTSLHRALGIGPTETFTSEMLDLLVEQQVAETADLDFKAKLDPHPTDPHSDVKKDLAAMANYGGGVIVYGVGENPDLKDHAGTRTDIGLVDAGYEQSYMSVAFGHVVPPIFGVEFHRIEDEKHHALVVVVPRSRQVPHMFFTEKKNNSKALSVPVRHGAHSEWLSESQIARLYRERFDAQRESSKALNNLYRRTMGLRGPRGFWMAGIALPSYSTVIGQIQQEEIQTLAFCAYEDELRTSYKMGDSPLSATNSSVRPGFRSWRFTESADKSGAPEHYVEFHHDGAVTVLFRLDTEHVASDDNGVHAYRLATVVGDLLACLRHYSERTGVRDYDVVFGVEWTGDESLALRQNPDPRFFSEDVEPIRRFVPVEATINIAGDDATIQSTARGLALDCLNQAGISRLTVFQ